MWRHEMQIYHFFEKRGVKKGQKGEVAKTISNLVGQIAKEDCKDNCNWEKWAQCRKTWRTLCDALVKGISCGHLGCDGDGLFGREEGEDDEGNLGGMGGGADSNPNEVEIC